MLEAFDNNGCMSSGVAGMSCRDGKKPIIGLVNGHAHGGGFEVALNCDLTLASPHATFRIPDCIRGMAALEGAYPRLCRVVGLQRAMDLSLTARRLSAAEAQDWGIILHVIPGDELLREGLKIARAIASVSPQAICAAREAIRDALDNGMPSQLLFCLLLCGSSH
jgi:enoyl-CoA hydratase/carnithine racemase